MKVFGPVRKVPLQDLSYGMVTLITDHFLNKSSLAFGFAFKRIGPHAEILSALAIVVRTIPRRRPRGALRTVTSTSCPSKERK